MTGQPAPRVALPGGLDVQRLLRRALAVGGLLVVVGLVAALAPGLGEVRDRLAEAAPGWLLVAVVLEVLSCLSYWAMFRPTFCPHMHRRTSVEIAFSELGVGALVPAGGAGGLALGVWALRRAGMAASDIAERTVAFFVIKSSANFAAVAVVGTVMGVALAGPSLSPALTLLPAGLAVATIAAVALLPRLTRDRDLSARASFGRPRRLTVRGLAALRDGVAQAGRLLREGDPRVWGGSLGYWAFDNAMLWVCFLAFGAGTSVWVILMAYLLGQLGGLLPLPGGIGGVDGGLVGALVLYGTPLASAAAAVLAYRAVLFWIPLLLGGVAFASLQRGLNRPDRPDLCQPPIPVGRLTLPRPAPVRRPA